MQCERGGEYKPPKNRKKPNLEGTGSRNTNEWWIAMLSGIHNHELAPKLADHLLASRIK